MRHNINIQDSALFGWLKENKKLAFEMVTGSKVVGRIVRFDRYCVMVRTDGSGDSRGAELLVYKHALASIQDPYPSARPAFDDHRRDDRRPRETHRPRRVAVAAGGRR